MSPCVAIGLPPPRLENLGHIDADERAFSLVCGRLPSGWTMSVSEGSDI